MTKPLRAPHKSVYVLPNFLLDTTGGSESHKCNDQEVYSNSCVRTQESCGCNTDNTTGRITSKGSSVNTCSASNNNEKDGESNRETPWQYTVDLSGCDEVQVSTNSQVLRVEGRGQRGNSKTMVQHLTTLPQNITADQIIATLNNGQLTVKQKAPLRLADVIVVPIVSKKELQSTDASPQREQCQHHQHTSHSQKQPQQQQQQRGHDGEDHQSHKQREPREQENQAGKTQTIQI